MKRAIPSDQKTYYMHILTRENRKRGLSTVAAISEAIRTIENGDFDWQKHFQASATGRAILARGDA